MKEFSIVIGTLSLCFMANFASAEVNGDAALELMKRSECFRCHSIDKKKEGPPYKEVASKLKGKPGAEEKLFKHLTTYPTIKIEGKEEDHITLKTHDNAEIRNVIRWILSL